jgi:hypothetical protein
MFSEPFSFALVASYPLQFGLMGSSMKSQRKKCFIFESVSRQNATIIELYIRINQGRIVSALPVLYVRAGTVLQLSPLFHSL